jgi:hypothetical protein
MKEVLSKGHVEPFFTGGEFESYTAALEAASKMADERNMPIQVTVFDVVRVVYPKALQDLGY